MATSKVKTKFYHYNQNNSGGYFVVDNEHGICEDVIIEAINTEDANRRFNLIGDKVDGMFDWCPCCGERWDYYPEESDKPEIYGTPIEKQKKEIFRERVFVHYFDGSFKEFVFPKKY
jgi:hypothetical protein